MTASAGVSGDGALAHDADVDGRTHLGRRPQSGHARAPRERARVRRAERRGARYEREKGDRSHLEARIRADTPQGVQAE